ncbi:hypothetical protein VNO80_12474 [Phaseolus coccineus]|uniref:Protein kinase domain-containing protein n=1 Tax=Phaseolus coccineus TaxID=3886 RepID=A0AAN9MZS9_PHACN
MITCSLHLFLLFSLTETLILPGSSNSNTWSVFQGVKLLWTRNKTVDKGNNGGHLKLHNLFMACEDRKNCSSITQSPGSDEFAKDTLVNYTSLNLSVAELNVHRVLITRNPGDSEAFPLPRVISNETLPYASRRNGKHLFWKSKVIIGVTSVGVVMGVFTICIIMYCFRYNLFTPLMKFCLTTKNDQDIEAFLKIHGAQTQKRYNFAEVKKMTNFLKVKLGQGGFGAVYKGKLPTGIPVAVKLLNASKRNGEEFMNEVASISRTSHVLDFALKISDFGLAKLCPKKESIISMADTRGTMGYVAPEMCNRQFGGVSHKSDVYSYGMMLLEMVGGRKNVNTETSHTSEIYFPHLIHKRLALNKDLRPDEEMTAKENEIAKRMTIVGLWCIQTFPNDRPTMSKVVDMLEDDMNFLEMPPKPMFSSPTRSTTESSF